MRLGIRQKGINNGPERRLKFDKRQRHGTGAGFGNFLKRTAFYGYTDKRFEARRRLRARLKLFLLALAVGIIGWFLIESIRALQLMD